MPAHERCKTVHERCKTVHKRCKTVHKRCKQARDTPRQSVSMLMQTDKRHELARTRRLYPCTHWLEGVHTAYVGLRTPCEPLQATIAAVQTRFTGQQTRCGQRPSP